MECRITQMTELKEQTILHDIEKDEFDSLYNKRYGYIPFTSHNKYHPTPLRIQLPSKYPDVYTTEYIYLPAYWDNEKRMRFICHIYKLVQLRSRM
jgi:hypothetical protein